VESILVVDDEDETRDALISLLEDAGYNVRSARDAAYALAISKGERIALVVSTLPLEDIDNVLNVRKPFDGDLVLRNVRFEIDHVEASRHRELLAAASDVRRQMEKTISDLAAVRRASSPDVTPPSRRRR
jgi:CheY-like chemotaxis protein